MILSRGRPISSARAPEMQRGLHHRLARDRARVLRVGRGGVLVHQLGQKLLIERAPVRADAHRLVVLDRHLDDRGKLRVLLLAEADVAGIDAVLVERLGAGRVIGEQRVADVVEVADQRHVDAHLQKLFLDVRHGGGGFVAVDRDAHDLGARAVERGDLADGAVDVGRVGVGHRLHHDGCAAADFHIADENGNGLAPLAGGCGLGHWSRS